MKTRRYGLLVGLLTMSVMAGSRAQAGDYPEKVVQIIEDSAAGSTPDVALRFVADELSKLWGQQVLVVNHPGAGGSLAARVARRLRPMDTRFTSRCRQLSSRCIQRRRTSL
jgi:tripartite-type tricarboxylate transporter receptor subunit TctC